jgi:putative addiction module component (TIGR02574 family)
MSTAEILAELPKLRADELAAVQRKLDELIGESWNDDGELSDSDKAALDAGLEEYRAHPDGGSTWDEVKARIQARLGQ